MEIQFNGAVREVTGSKHLITTNSGKKILLDCGMYQGKGLETDEMNRDLGFDPRDIDHIILTHAHIDHSGLIPYVYKQGFRGSVICTFATRDLCSIMLVDSGFIQERDVYYFNKKRARKGLKPVEPLYNKDDARDAMELFIGVPYNRKFNIDNSINVKFTNTGHMLGSGVANIEITEDGTTKRIAYTGDIGRPSNRILKNPDAFPQTDILICESTYGDRLHNESDRGEEDLLDVVYDTCVRKGGKLIIPSFSVGRTQDLVYSLNNFYNEGRLPKIDIFVDSPLATNATEIFRIHPECFNKDILEIMETDPDPFGFNTLHYTKSVDESKSLNFYDKPCVIISASGMAEAGRVKHHLANNISNPKNTILFVGYCAPTTLGARIMSGAKRISIHGFEYEVNADIRRIESYSGHGDYKEMIDFLKCQDFKKITDTILVHGDQKPMEFYKHKLKQEGLKNVHIPQKNDTLFF
ncbi:MAG TPA: MBL fold metallo-hydrolase [Tenuifilaceae bacterium]|nr:MBL fold metallo-hydrolase [Tenuifilaceae bacterium]HPE17417.1 MBL fold metallo-hydrolase [Tenuifilaceae bacterium]HPJ46144.1 MBL fold metallo-hydrolase [Tenuifilaceae bacterium]HPQ34531.1 MBL fold metallo-hydrolase [Tenuifilaceae bacterium]HRX66892.1 MBL fold metallo-hydrolase [Tenuifilaceae bacterium]